MTYVTLEGNAGKQPELKTSKTGKSYCRFSIAWSERQKTGDQWIDGPTVWVSVTCFGRVAENAAATITKGTRVIVSGNLKPELWSSNHGEETVFTLTADKIGPALTFATAQVSVNSRGGHSGGWQNQGQQQQQSAWGNQPSHQGNTGGFSATQTDDEEPPF